MATRITEGIEHAIHINQQDAFSMHRDPLHLAWGEVADLDYRDKLSHHTLHPLARVSHPLLPLGEGSGEGSPKRLSSPVASLTPTPTLSHHGGGNLILTPRCPFHKSCASTLWRG